MKEIELQTWLQRFTDLLHGSHHAADQFVRDLHHNLIQNIRIEIVKENEFHNISRFVISNVNREEPEMKPEKDLKKHVPEAPPKLQKRESQIQSNYKAPLGFMSTPQTMSTKAQGLRSASTKQPELQLRTKGSYMQATSAWSKKVEQQTQRNEEVKTKKMIEEAKYIKNIEESKQTKEKINTTIDLQ